MPKTTLTEKRYSVCVGINHYQHLAGLSQLHYAEADAQAVDSLLGTVGFAAENRRLLLGESAILEAVNEALSTMILDAPAENDLVVFYFAGHSLPLTINEHDVENGAEPKSEVFLATYDFDRQRIRSKLSFRQQQALGMERLRTHFFEGEGPRKRLFLFDSCYSGDFYGPRYRGVPNVVQGYIQHMLDSKSVGRVALSSCLPIQRATEDATLGHGRFTYYVLEALSGRAVDALGRDGCLTVSDLFKYLAAKLPEDQRPVLSGVQQDIFTLVCYRDKVVQTHASPLPAEEVRWGEKKEQLQALFADHSGFMRDRLDSFVGRQKELAEIHQRIAEQLSTGGYVTITGQAGQGKSSIIAKLVEEYGLENVAFHFISFNPGPDHQVGLLRNLMARLILKYNLSDLYVASESRPALRDYFPKVLGEIAARGAREVIFVDGLDQLEADVNGFRDLSFLPNNPPPGIVFVLGTRPNDTLEPLELLKPYYEYKLPDLSRQDFDLILEHRHVHLGRYLADQFYQAMQENALYLDLVAKELREREVTSAHEMVNYLASNPENIFSLSIRRLKRAQLEWREVLKPLLGVLLASREPLSLWQIRHILQIEDDLLRGGVARLGGLLADTGQRRYTLFHSKFRDFLKQDEDRPEKEYVFATDEEEAWHARLAAWCEQGHITRIWDDAKVAQEQERREYARRHYVTHLYYAREWQRLFDILDEGTYGRSKERYDLSTRSYSQDLDLGRRAAAWSGWTMEEGLALLPYLWRYTLLRCSLRSRADQYPLALFQSLLLLKRDAEVLGLAELLTDPSYKVRVLLQIAKHLTIQEPGNFQIFLRAREVARSIGGSHGRVEALSAVATALAESQQWEQAAEVAHSIEDSATRAEALKEVVVGLARNQQWEQARLVTAQAEEEGRSIENSHMRVGALKEVAVALARNQQWEQAKLVGAQAEEAARSIEDSGMRVEALKEVAVALVRSQRWVQAKEVACSIEDSYARAWALKEVAIVLAGSQQWEQAKEVARLIDASDARAWALKEIAVALAESQQWVQAIEEAHFIESIDERMGALKEVAVALARNQQWVQVRLVYAQVEEEARSIEDSSTRAEGLKEAATAIAESQQWEQAVEEACSIEDSAMRAEALKEVATALAKSQQWVQATEVARLIEDSDARAWALGAVAKVLAESQQWEQAIEEARLIEDSDARVEALSAVATTLAESQQWVQAIEVARLIEDSYARAWALKEIVKALVKSQQWEQAIEVARSIEDSYARAWALKEIAIGLAKNQQWEQAMEVARSIENSDAQVEALKEVAVGLARSQQWEQAIEVARLIEDSDARVEALKEVVAVLAESQQWEQAIEVARSIEDSDARVEALSAVATALAESQQGEQAEEEARSIEDSDVRAWALKEVAEALVDQPAFNTNLSSNRYSWYSHIKRRPRVKNHENQAQFTGPPPLNVAVPYSSNEESTPWSGGIHINWNADWYNLGKIMGLPRSKAAFSIPSYSQGNSLAESLQWEQAAEEARSIEGIHPIKVSGMRAWALGAVATALVKSQQWEQAMEVARLIEGSDARAWALKEIAVGLARSQQWEQAIEVARLIEDSYARVGALGAVAIALARSQQWEQAIEVARSIEDSATCAWALSAVVAVLAERQQWEQAIEVARSIEDSRMRLGTLSAVATALAKSLRWEQAIEVARSIEDSDARVEALGAVATALAQSQQWEQAIEVARSIEDNRIRARAWNETKELLTKAGEYEQLLCLVQHAWLQAETRGYALQLFSLALDLVSLKPEIGVAFYKAFIWVDTFLSG